MLRGSRDFASGAGYAQFLKGLLARLNAGRQQRLAEEMAVMKELPERRLESYKRERVRVDSGSLIYADRNVYSVPSRVLLVSAPKLEGSGSPGLRFSAQRCPHEVCRSRPGCSLPWLDRCARAVLELVKGWSKRGFPQPRFFGGVSSRFFPDVFWCPKLATGIPSNHLVDVERSFPSAKTRGAFDRFDGSWRVVHLHDQFAVPLVMQVNDDGFLRVMHVPEESLAVLIEGSRRDDSGHVGSRHPNAVIPAPCDLRVCTDTSDVYKRDFEAALESPELVCAPNVQHQLAHCYRQIHQSERSELGV